MQKKFTKWVTVLKDSTNSGKTTNNQLLESTIIMWCSTSLYIISSSLEIILSRNLIAYMRSRWTVPGTCAFIAFTFPAESERVQSPLREVSTWSPMTTRASSKTSRGMFPAIDLSLALQHARRNNAITWSYVNTHAHNYKHRTWTFDFDCRPINISIIARMKCSPRFKKIGYNSNHMILCGLVNITTD